MSVTPPGMSYIDIMTDTSAINDLMPTVKGELCFDIGANGGKLANIFAENFDVVVAVEPCEESFAKLRADRADNVIAICEAASDHIGNQEFRETKYTKMMGELMTGYSLDHWGPSVGERVVPCVTLDHLALKYGYPDFVKIDTEGHEWKIMQGAHEVFARMPRFIIEIHDKLWGDNIKAMLNHMGIFFSVYQHEKYLEANSPLYDSHYWLVRV
jgi:FkbM family methyltransferase